MSVQPGRTPRTLSIADHLWDLLEQMSVDMGVERESLVNQALFALARQNGYTPGPARVVPAVPVSVTTDAAPVVPAAPAVEAVPVLASAIEPTPIPVDPPVIVEQAAVDELPAVVELVVADEPAVVEAPATPPQADASAIEAALRSIESADWFRDATAERPAVIAEQQVAEEVPAPLPVEPARPAPLAAFVEAAAAPTGAEVVPLRPSLAPATPAPSAAVLDEWSDATGEPPAGLLHLDKPARTPTPAPVPVIEAPVIAAPVIPPPVLTPPPVVPAPVAAAPVAVLDPIPATPSRPSLPPLPMSALSAPDLGTPIDEAERKAAQERVLQKAAELERLVSSGLPVADDRPLELDIPAAPTPVPAALPTRALVIIDAEGKELARLPSVDRYLIGRGKDCDLVLSSPKVSREHAQIVQDGAAWYLEDLGSSNGTWFDKRRITRQEIVSGESFTLAEVKLSFRID